MNAYKEFVDDMMDVLRERREGKLSWEEFMDSIEAWELDVAKYKAEKKLEGA